jgi:hypothetical protein
MYSQRTERLFLLRVALAEDTGDFPPLSVDDAGQDQVQVTADVHLLPRLAGVNPAPPPVEDIPGQGVELLDFAPAAFPSPRVAAELRYDGSLAYKITRISPVPYFKRDALNQPF